MIVLLTNSSHLLEHLSKRRVLYGVVGDSMAVGDILFYESNGGLIDNAILNYSSPFVHCAIALDDSQSIEAQVFRGIIETMTSRNPAATRAARGTNIAHGIAWLKEQVGRPYSIFDVVDVVLRRDDIPISIPSNSFDCSSLAATFLTQCGVCLPFKDMAIVTPQMLFDFL